MPHRRPKSAPQPVKRSLSPALWALPLTLIATVAVFAPAVNFQFVFDDRYQIAQNPTLASWSYLPLYFRSHVWGYAGGFTNYYRPLWLTTLRFWESIVGLDPVGWHVLPIALHIVNVALVFAIARKLSHNVTTGLIASALFALHPVQIEAVASVYGANETVMAVSLLAAFWAYLRFRETGRAFWMGLSAVLFAISLLTKENAIVLPVVIAAYELTMQPRSWHSAPQAAESARGTSNRTRLWASILPAVIAAAILVAYFVVRRFALGTLFGRVDSSVSWTTVFLTAPLSLITLLRLWVAPFGMSAFYDSLYVKHLGTLHFFAPLLLLMALAAGTWVWSRRTREPLVAFGALWAFFSVAPVLDIRLLQPGDFVHIRFLYVPSVALSILAAMAMRQAIPQPRLRVVAVAVCVVALAAATRAQLPFLQDNEAMYRRGIAVAPDNRVPENNLADDYVKAGRIDEAAVLLDDNLRRHPDFWMSNYNRGYIAYRRQNWPEVVDYMSRAIAGGSTEIDAYAYRAFALLHLGRPQEAEQSIRQAIAIRPNAHTYHFVLGLALRQEQRWDEALTAFQQEMAIDPSNREAALYVADLRARLHK